MDIEKKFQIALVMCNMDYKKFGQIFATSNVSIGQSVRALKNGKRFSSRLENAIVEFTNKQIKILREKLNSEAA